MNDTYGFSENLSERAMMCLEEGCKIEYVFGIYNSGVGIYILASSVTSI